MFNKRETRSGEDPTSNHSEKPDPGESSQVEPPPRNQGPAGSRRAEAAVIGPSIHISGDLRGEEDLIIEGEVKGTVHLESNSLTIGSQGKVTADVYAHTIVLEGFMKGDLYASERVQIRKSARMQGNIHSPRVALEDGARFKGSIEMDPESEALKSAFGDKRTAGRSPDKASANAGKSDSPGGDKPRKKSSDSRSEGPGQGNHPQSGATPTGASRASGSVNRSG